MLGYFILVFCCTCLAAIYDAYASKGDAVMRSRARLAFTFVIIILVVYAGIRNTAYVGTDEYRYRLATSELMGLSLNQSFERLGEAPLFTFLCWISENIFGSTQAMIFISAFVTQSIIVCFLRDVCHKFSIGIFIYLASTIYQTSFVPIPQYVAIAVSLSGLRLLNKDRDIAYAIVIIAASLFHQSAIIMLVLLIAKRVEPNILKGMLFCLLVFLASVNYRLILSYLTGSVYESYLEAERFFYGMSSLRIWFWCVQYAFSIFCFFLFRKGNSKGLKESQRIMIWATIASLALYLASSQYIMFSRLEMYFGMFGVALCSDIPRYFSKSSRKIVGAIMMIVYCIYGSYSITQMAPYRTMFEIL